jgi:predicted ester cyclase
MSKTREELKEGCRRFVEEVFNQRNLGYAERVLDVTCVDHSPPADFGPDKSGAIARLKRLIDATGDLRAETVDVVSDGRHVGVRVRYTGTDTGGLFPGVPPTGRPFDIEGIDIAVVNEDGRVIEHYGIIDMKDAMEQLGLAPFAGEP